MAKRKGANSLIVFQNSELPSPMQRVSVYPPSFWRAGLPVERRRQKSIGRVLRHIHRARNMSNARCPLWISVNRLILGLPMIPARIHQTRQNLEAQDLVHREYQFR